MTLALLYLASYLIGAIPFGVVIARAAGIDIMSQGSGNPGATNVWRILGAKYGVAVFVLDVLKGLGPALAGGVIGGTKEQAIYCGMIAIVGHSLSPFLKFRGGKGISTGLGALLGSVPVVALSSFAVFLVSMLFTRWVSFSSLVAAVAMMSFCFLFGEPPTVKWVLGGMALFIFYRHRTNIVRLMNGTEPKFKFKTRDDSSAPGAEPPAPGAEPPAPGAEPSAPGAEPSAPGAEPSAPGAEPPAPRAEPPAPGAEPPAPRAEPPAPRAEPPAPRAEPSAPRAEPSAPWAEPPAEQADPPQAILKGPSDPESR